MPRFQVHSVEWGERLADEGEADVLLVWGQNLHQMRVMDQCPCTAHTMTSTYNELATASHSPSEMPIYTIMATCFQTQD